MTDHGVVAQPQPAEPASRSGVYTLTLTTEEFERLRDLLASYSGVYLDAARQRVLTAGLAQRLAATGDSLERYEQRICSPLGRDEMRKLAELVLNHETFFFRNKPHMRVLQEVLLPELRQRKPIGAPIHIWSAGCATGEEPYSLAITLLETFGPTASQTCKVTATDMSHAALARARAGYYQGRSLGNLTPAMLARYFVPHGSGYLVNDTLRSMVQFDVLNLLEPFPSIVQNVDIIFCQNVLIYFQLDTSLAVLERFHTTLSDGGLLFLGFSETLWNVFDAFQSRQVQGAYVYYKAPKPPRRATAPLRLPQNRSAGTVASGRPSPPRAPRPAKPAVTDRGAASDAPHTSDQTLFEEGRDLLQHGRPDKALDVLRRIAPHSTYAPRALTLVARVHADRGDLDLAAAEAQRAIEIDQMNQDAYVLLGVLSSRQGQWQQAAQQFEKARYLDPAASLISFYLAEAYMRLERADVAAREYRATLWKLRACAPDDELDGVAVSWIRSTCEQQIKQLAR